MAAQGCVRARHEGFCRPSIHPRSAQSGRGRRDHSRGSAAGSFRRARRQRGLGAAFCAPASGRAGCGGTSDGRWPVVVGSDGAAACFGARRRLRRGVACAGCGDRGGERGQRKRGNGQPGRDQHGREQQFPSVFALRSSAGMSFSPRNCSRDQRSWERMVPSCHGGTIVARRAGNPWCSPPRWHGAPRAAAAARPQPPRTRPDRWRC